MEKGIQMGLINEIPLIHIKNSLYDPSGVHIHNNHSLDLKNYAIFGNESPHGVSTILPINQRQLYDNGSGNKSSFISPALISQMNTPRDVSKVSHGT
jgi:hypothetical protein